ncbi:MAG: penicillin acylase family protein [Thermodesulfobacteriota bacterium]
MSGRDDERRGFGGRPWDTGLRPTPRREVDPRGGDAGSPFGGASWGRGVAADVEGAEDDEESGETPRRRRGVPEPSPYPRKTVAALGARAKIVRDSAGVPHVTAKTERDAYAALGFCMAEDRLWQLDVLRRLACGRLAEVLGEPFARHDALMRTVGIPRRAAVAANRLEGVARDVLAAFVGGLNAVRAESKPEECRVLEYEMEPWTIADSLAVELYATWEMSLETWPHKMLIARALATAGLERARWVSPPGLDLGLVPEQILALWRRLDLRILDHVTAMPAGGGSNGWAVGRERAEGGAIVAGDPHLATTLPSVMYLAHLEAPGFAVAGAAHAGGPVLQLGRNKHCAWGVTNFSLDDADCVIEELDGIGNFRTESGWSPLNRRSELIRVRGGESLKFEVAETRNGPLLSHLVSQLDGPHAEMGVLGIALRWGVNSLGSALPGWLALARASSLAEVEKAAALLDKGPLALNLYAADATGAVGHWGIGGLPVREAAARLPVRGWCGEGRWTAVSGLSAVCAQRRGDVVVTANEAHLDARTAKYPAHAYGDHAYRARRIRERLAEQPRVTVDACRELQRDVVDLAAVDVLPHVKRALARPEVASHPALARAVPLLQEWQGEARADSGAAALFYVAMFGHLLRDLFPEQRFGPLARMWRFAWWGVAKIVAAPTSPWFPTEDDKDRALVGAFGRAATWLAETRGDDPSSWSWGALHELAPRHPLAGHESFAAGAPEPWAAPGSPFTVLQHRLAGTAPPYPIVLSPVARMIADLSTDEVKLALPTGQSGQVRSAHLLDQVEAWRRGDCLTLRLGVEVTGDTTELVPG